MLTKKQGIIPPDKATTLDAAVAMSLKPRGSNEEKDGHTGCREL